MTTNWGRTSGQAMTVNQFREHLRVNGFQQARVMHAASDDGRTIGSPIYDLHAETEGAYQMRLALLQAELRGRNWVDVA